MDERTELQELRRLDELERKASASSSPAPKESQKQESSGLLNQAAPYAKGAITSGLVGYATPEILTGAGLAAGTFPLTAPAAPFLLGAGQLARGGRLASSLAGAGGYLAGQGLKKVTPEPEKTLFSVPGASVTRGEAAEAVGELGAPLAAKIPGYIVSKTPLVGALLKAAEERGFQTPAKAAAVNELANFRNKVSVNSLLQSERLRVSPDERSSYERVVNKLKDADKETQSNIAGSLSAAQDQANQILSGYASRANEIVKTNKELAQRVLAEGDRRAQEIMNNAVKDADRKLAIKGRATRAGEQAIQTKQQSLQSIGNANAFEADTGKNIQQRINNVVSEEQKTLNTAYNQAKKDVNADIEDLESSGKNVTTTNAYKELVDYIDKALNKGAYEKAPLTQTTESSLVSSLNNIDKSIKGKVNQKVNSEGKLENLPPIPPAFKAIDDVRKKLGEAYSGKPPEGFEALTKDQAQKLYKLIRKVQVEFAGGENGKFDMLLRDYSEGKDLLNALKIPPGQKIIKKDLINPEYFTYDPSGLPREFFSSAKKVQDLMTLTKDPAFVESQASNHVARVLSDKDAAGASKYLKDNDEWLSLMPNLKAKVQAHIAASYRAESVGGKTADLSKALKTEIKTIPETAKSAAEKVKSDAAKEAKRLEDEAAKQAKQIMREGKDAAKTQNIEKLTPIIGTGDPIQQLKKMIVSGYTAKLRQAAPFINSDPEVKKAFRAAMLQRLSEYNPSDLAGTSKLPGDWESKIKPALLETGLIDQKTADEVSSRIKNVRLILEPNKAVNSILYIIRQTASGEVGKAASGQ